jgi:hypothetical protein
MYGSTLLQAAVIETSPARSPLEREVGFKFYIGLILVIKNGLKKNTINPLMEPLNNVFMITLAGRFYALFKYML